MSNSAKFSLKAVLSVLMIALAGCAQTYEAKSVSQHIDNSSLRELNRSGQHTVNLNLNGPIAGDALVLGIFGSAHTYQFDMSPDLEKSVEQIVAKIYANAQFEITKDEQFSIDPDKISIDVGSPIVRLNCFAVSQTNMQCEATTRLEGMIKVPSKEVFAISISENESSSSGILYQNGADAISASIGNAINNFSARLYNYLASL